MYIYLKYLQISQYQITLYDIVYRDVFWEYYHTMKISYSYNLNVKNRIYSSFDHLEALETCIS